VTLFPAQDSLARGEISPRLHARAGIELYRSALAICENFITLPHGGVRKRGGTYFAGETVGSLPERPWPFIFSEEQAYMLFFGDGYFRVYAYGGVVEVSPGNPVSVATPYGLDDLAGLQFEQSGDVLYVVHPNYEPRKITRASNADWTITAYFPDDGPFLSGNVDTSIKMYSSINTGTVTLTATSPIFSPANLGQMVRLQVETYETWRPWEPGTLVTNGNPNGELRRYNGNIYEAVNGSAVPGGMYTGGTPPTHLYGDEYDGGGSATESGSNATYGITWRYLHSGFGVALITAVAGDGLSATAETLQEFPAEVIGSGNATYRWSFGALREENYPRTVAIFEERLFFGDKYSVYGSKTFDLTSFRSGADDVDSVSYSLSGTQDIVWLHPGDEFLLVGTIGGVKTLGGGGQNQQLTPTSFKSRASPTKRCSSIQPAKAGAALMYVGHDRKSVVELQYSLERNGYRTVPMGLISEHIPKQGISTISFASEPDSIFWMGLDNGELGGLTYEEDQNVRGWHRQRLGGSFGDTPYGVIEYQATTPGLDGKDDTWFVVKRTIGGVTKRYIEVLQTPFEYEEVEDAFLVDCGLSYDSGGVSQNSLAGMDHLAGEAVVVLADARVYRLTVSAGGVVTLPNGQTASKWHVGLPYTATLETLELDVGGRDGSVMGRRKKVGSVILSVLESANIYVRSASRSTGVFDLQRAGRITVAPSSETVSLYTGNLDPVLIDDTWEGRGRIRIEAPDPVPCTIRAIMPAFDSEAS
jgi:hypothetical protein